MNSCLTPMQVEQIAADRQHSRSSDGEMRAWLDHIKQCPDCARRLERCREDGVLADQLRNAVADCSATSEKHTTDLNLFEVARSRSAQGVRTPPADAISGYRIVREIHRGGQGIVLEAVQESTNRTVAVKIMLDGALAGERTRWRFEQEVKLVAGLKHPNIVVIHDSGIHQGNYFYAMDYVRGQPLDTHVRLAKLSAREIVRLLVSICDAISYAHQRGIIHRDLKPSNILVGEDGVPQVLDFGLAKLAGGVKAAGRESLTVTGQIMGTIRYMSPEQTRGNADAIDVRTDIYSLGVILYELLTGLPPYPTDVELFTALKNIREADPVRPSRVRREVKTELDAIVLRAMAKEPERRYQSASELMADLTAWQEGRPVSAKSDSSFYVLRKLAVRHYFHSSVILALFAAIVGFTSISYHAVMNEREARRRQGEAESGMIVANEGMSEIGETLRKSARQHAIGWLLLEWREGRTARARAILSELGEESPEYAAMRYLVEGDVSPHHLREALLPSAAALYHFVLGEQALVEGDRRSSRESYEACLSAPGGNYAWLRRSAQARLDQLKLSATPTARDISPRPQEDRSR